MKKMFILSDWTARRNAIDWISDTSKVPDGHVVRISPPTRTLDQNALLWPLLDQISRGVEWFGKKHSRDDWKNIFTAHLFGFEMVPNLDGTGFVALGKSTSNMSKKDFSDLIELIYSFGAEKGIYMGHPIQPKD